VSYCVYGVRKLLVFYCVVLPLVFYCVVLVFYCDYGVRKPLVSLCRTVCIFSHPIQPHLQVTEDVLMREFGAYGPIASVKIMWPRTQVCCVCSGWVCSGWVCSGCVCSGWVCSGCVCSGCVCSGCVVRVSVLMIFNCAKIMRMRRSRSITLQHTARQCNTLQHTAGHCNT